MDELNGAGALDGPFNSPVEVGLRALVTLTATHPAAHSLQRLTVLDYLVVHSDDVPDGPPGLHPQTPYRAGELLMRRAVLEDGLLLYESRGMVERRFETAGVFYAATDRAGAFLDVFAGPYMDALRDRAARVTERFKPLADEPLFELVDSWIGEWGAEFTRSSLLHEELT
jgi:hypothetical protein